MPHYIELHIGRHRSKVWANSGHSICQLTRQNSILFSLEHFRQHRTMSLTHGICSQKECEYSIHMTFVQSLRDSQNNIPEPRYQLRNVCLCLYHAQIQFSPNFVARCAEIFQLERNRPFIIQVHSHPIYPLTRRQFMYVVYPFRTMTPDFK